MSSQTPRQSAKRRRVEMASLTLSRPFRSPLLNRPKSDRDGKPDAPGVSTPSRPATSRAEIARPAARRPKVSGVTLEAELSPGSRPAATPTSKPEGVPFTKPSEQPGVSGPSREDLDASLELSRRVRKETAAALKKMQDELAVAEQADRTVRESQVKRPGGKIDTELEEQVAKWKTAGRLVAEELYELTKERYANSGGKKAWREARKRRMEEMAWGFGDQAWERRKGDEGEGEERDVDDEEEGENDGWGDEDEGYTMAMMLKALAIEPKTIGYDPVEDRWVQ